MVGDGPDPHPVASGIEAACHCLPFSARQIREAPCPQPRILVKRGNGILRMSIHLRQIGRAFLVAVLPEIPDQDCALAELRRVLKPQGVLSITEEFADPDYRFPGETIRCVEAAGFRLEERFGNLWVYTVNFRKVA